MKLLIFTILTCLCFISFSQDGMVVDQKTGKITYAGIGTVTFVTGKVYRTKEGEKNSEELGVNFQILKKDIIQTDRKSAIKIIMNDSTIITLGQNSHFNFKNYEQVSKSNRDADYDLKMGKARVEVPVKVAKGKLNFNTRTVSLGVRGTEFLMQQEIDKSGNLKEQIALLEGALEVTREDGKKSEMSAGEHYMLAKDGANNTIKDKLIKLDKEVLNYLKAENVSKNTIKPFLADLNTKLLDENDSSKNGAQNSDGKDRFKKVKNFWEKSLEKLNQKLRKDNE